MSIQEVGVSVASQSQYELRLLKTPNPGGKESVTESSISVSLSEEALARVAQSKPQPTKEESEKVAREMAALRNSNMASHATGPRLDSAFYGDPATANDAVSFIDFFYHSNISADDMATALHQALTSPQGSGNETTLGMDVAMTQAKLNYVVDKFVSADYQQQAREFVAGFVAKKGEQADQIQREVLTQSVALAQSLGDTGYAKQNQQAIEQLDAGTHSSQIARKEMLASTANSSDSNSWFAQMNQQIEKGGSLPFMTALEKGHLNALQQQWTQFTTLLKAAEQPAGDETPRA
ncbi:hypothetical protein [Kosakonia cowanii]|uniref:hypothetical protein n=1 Tax=Kosakonia cowanii TaxID=208223 RepID=UPI00406292FE